MSNELRFDPEVACDRCHRFGAFRFDGATLCGDCYETRGSCCPEFGGDDLYARTEPLARHAEPGSPLKPLSSSRPR